VALPLFATALVVIPQGVGTLLSRSLDGRFMDSCGPGVVAVAAFVLTCAATVPFGFVTCPCENLVHGAHRRGR
jgi:hypothetical protein